MGMSPGDTDASSGLSKYIKDELNAQGLIPPQQEDEEDEVYQDRIDTGNKFYYALGKALISYLKDEMEVNNIDISDPAGVVELYVAGAGSNGGSMIAAPYPVSGSVSKSQQTLSQNNSGTGHVN